MNMTNVRLFEEVADETKLKRLIGRLREEDAVPIEQSLSPWCGIDNLSHEQLASNR